MPPTARPTGLLLVVQKLRHLSTSAKQKTSASSGLLQFLDRAHGDIERIAQGASLGPGERQTGEVGPHIKMHVVRRRGPALGKVASIREGGSGLGNR